MKQRPDRSKQEVHLSATLLTPEYTGIGAGVTAAASQTWYVASALQKISGPHGEYEIQRVHRNAHFHL